MGKASPNHTNLLGTIRAHSVRNRENKKAEKQIENKYQNISKKILCKITATGVLTPQDMTSLSRSPTYFSGFSLTVNNWEKEENSQTKNQEDMQKAYIKATKF